MLNRSHSKKTGVIGRAQNGHDITPGKNSGMYMSDMRADTTKNVEDLQQYYDSERKKFVRVFPFTSPSITISYTHTERWSATRSEG